MDSSPKPNLNPFTTTQSADSGGRYLNIAVMWTVVALVVITLVIIVIFILVYYDIHPLRCRRCRKSCKKCRKNRRRSRAGPPVPRPHIVHRHPQPPYIPSHPFIENIDERHPHGTPRSSISMIFDDVIEFSGGLKKLQVREPSLSRAQTLTNKPVYTGKPKLSNPK